MKKLLSILAISGLVGSASTTVVSCGEDSTPIDPAPTVPTPLSDIIKNPNIGSVHLEERRPYPDEDAINQSILTANPGYDKRYTVILYGISATGATIKGDGIHYTDDKVNVTYTTPLSDTITDNVLGSIVASSVTTTPTDDEINTAILESNPDYNKDYTTITESTTTGATINTNNEDTHYNGSVKVSYTIAALDATPLSSIIKDPNLTMLPFTGDEPTVDEVNEKLVSAFPSYDENLTTIKNISPIWATVTGIPLINDNSADPVTSYSGSVIITFTKAY